VQTKAYVAIGSKQVMNGGSGVGFCSVANSHCPVADFKDSFRVTNHIIAILESRSLKQCSREYVNSVLEIKFKAMKLNNMVKMACFHIAPSTRSK